MVSMNGTDAPLSGKAPAFFKTKKQENWVYGILFCLIFFGALIYELFYIQKLPLMFDEFIYLFKGNQFVQGAYQPYQQYGFYMNKMPISYYLFGLAQHVAGVGLKTGRVFSVIMAFLTILTYWGITTRLRGKWAGLLIMLAFVINPSLMGIYGLADSQAIGAFFFALSLWIITIESPKDWQIILSSLFCAILILTRVNLFPVIIFLVVYHFWVHGRRAGFISLISSLLFVIAGHLLFAPGIFQIWIEPLPQILKDLIPTYTPVGGVSAWDPDIQWVSRLHSFWQTMRLNFIGLVGFLDVLLFTRLKKKELDKGQKRIILLSALFIVLFALHAWETLAKQRCVYCLTPYVSFFYGLAVLILLLSIPYWDVRNKKRNRLAVFANLLVIAGIGFGTYTDLGPAMLKMTVPRFKDFHFLSGTTEISALVRNKFAISMDMQKLFLPPLFFLIIACVLLVVILILNKTVLKKKTSGTFIFCATVLLLGCVLTPTAVLSGNYYEGQLTCDTITDLERVADDLQQKIPAGALVYWGNYSGAHPLMYLSDFAYFPPQFEADYSLRIGGDAQELEKQGYWNEESAARWFEQADIILVNNKEYQSDMVEKLSIDQFDELPPTPALNCQDPFSYLRIYIRK